MSHENQKRQNRLANEQSPYLLQHADNPVDWYPWGEDAFTKATQEDKPIFLSIGYSTCHWCHVMAHESFENPDIAALMNEHFVNVKVDREERPDVDRVHMTFVQATTGSGGWPMSIWLTPDLNPFYGGTYFPPEDRHQRQGFPSILRVLSKIWREDRERILKQGAHSVLMLQQFAGRSMVGDAALESASIDQIVSWFHENFDEQNGGFGGAPKFPRPPMLQLLTRAWVSARDSGQEGLANDLYRMNALTMQKMSEGGIRDHLGGGFHRYSVDAYWHVPHFEKMLYDQGQLVVSLLQTYQITGEQECANVARETLDYVQRDLTDPRGGFFSAEDADSVSPEHGGESREGAFYVWSAAEVRSILGPELSPMFVSHYGVEENGNAPPGGDPLGEFTNLNILIERACLRETASEFGLEESVAAEKIATCREKLLAVRNQRPRPHRDEKIIAAWNGLMISAFARGACILDDTKLADVAVRAAMFIREAMFDEKTGILRRSDFHGRAGPEGFAEDYAFLIQSLIDLYEATFDIQWLQWAVRLQETQDRLFFDTVGGGYFSSTGTDASVLVRLKEDHDGAEPSPSSVSVLNLLRLGRMLGNEEMIKRARQTLRGFSESWSRSPQGLPLMLVGLLDWQSPPRQVVLAGKPGSDDFEALAREVRKRFLPGLVVLAADGSEGQQWLAARVPYLRETAPVDGKAGAYVCENFSCKLPVASLEDLALMLS
jgi:uncharacterized protein YyaL (SSP411 family)